MKESRKVSIRRKLVIVGDWNVGKTQILNVMAGREFSSVGLTGSASAAKFDTPKDRYQPCVMENHVMDLEMNRFQLELALWDTKCQEDYDRLRPLSYSNCAIIVLCFAINDQDSFRSVTERWHPEILHFTAEAKVPLLLVGSKCDLRCDHGLKNGEDSNQLKVEVSREEGSLLATQIGVAAYRECSAKTGEGMEELCRLIGEMATSWDPEKSQRSGCLIA